MLSFEIRVRCKNNFIIFTNAPWAKRSRAHGAITKRDHLNDNMANKPIQFFLREQKLNIGKQAGKTVIVARPTGRHRVDFRNFCERIAKSTTFNAQEVAAVLNLASETARDIVANGDIVEFGDMGTLTPSFKSKAVESVEQFRAQQHIEKPVIKFLASAKYFTLNDVTYEQVTPREKKEKKGKKEKKKAEGTESPGPVVEG